MYQEYRNYLKQNIKQNFIVLVFLFELDENNYVDFNRNIAVAWFLWFGFELNFQLLL